MHKLTQLQRGVKFRLLSSYAYNHVNIMHYKLLGLIRKYWFQYKKILYLYPVFYIYIFIHPIKYKKIEGSNLSKIRHHVAVGYALVFCFVHVKICKCGSLRALLMMFLVHGTSKRSARAWTRRIHGRFPYICREPRRGPWRYPHLGIFAPRCLGLY